MAVFLLSGKAPHNSALSGGKSVLRESFQTLPQPTAYEEVGWHSVVGNILAAHPK